ncbi:hypothetical protein [Frankia sp. AgKG'84/4]|uniref:hypothetical protein n=1 Tax=Frankia sp. AgKG'84/4 TaxID=573490 RepID=UPI00200FD2FB|nr:hypothetical protein [Frankia sp. AgKG'84/4]MCL9795031.1 hypothetical protein [Frankia sp. AgKG'84/4]
MAVTEALISVPEDVRERLERIAGEAGMSLRAYLTRLAHSVEVYSEEERRERSERALSALFAFSGYNPTPAEAAEHEADFQHWLARYRQPATR